MNAILRFLLLTIFLCTTVHAVEPDSTLISKAYAFDSAQLPRTVDDTSIPNVTRIPGTDSFDCRALLELRGVTFPEGSEALYFPSTQGLLVRNTLANHKRLESMNGTCGLVVGIDLKVTLSVAAFLIDADSEAAKKLNYADLKSAAGQSWNEIVSFSGVAKMGEPLVMERLSNPQGNLSDCEKLPTGVFGGKARIEVATGRVGGIAGSKVSFQFREKKENEIHEVAYSGNAPVRFGVPKVLQLEIANGHGVATILTVDYLPIEDEVTVSTETESIVLPQ